MSNLFSHLWDGNGFMPHGMCYLWQPGILTLHVASDALIAAAYFSIPFTLAHFVRKRKDIEFNFIIACFAIFIIACGATHLMEIVTIWHPAYWVSGAVKAVTAAASVPTALLLVKLMPQALRWPSPEALQHANEELQRANRHLVAEAAERQRAEAQLQRVNYELQEQIAAMRRLHEMGTRLAHAHELPNVLEEILDSTIDLQKADYGNVQLYDEQTSSLRTVAQRGFSREFVEQFREVQSDDRSACGRALQARQRVIIEDVEQDAEYAPYRASAARAGYRAVQSTPIVGRGDSVKGMLSTHFRQPHRPSETDLQITDLYTRLAAVQLERAQDEKELREARDAADRANRAKGRFLATASHDLRQPLQTLSLLNSSLQRVISSTEVMNAVAEQEQAIVTMSQMLNALLDIGKLESGAVEPQICDFDLAPLFEELRLGFSELAQKKGLELEIAEQTAIVRSDRTLLGQILRNLLSNAIRYTLRGVVRVRAERDDGWLRIDVEDSGIGISRDQLGTIFEDFYQVGVAPNSVREGYGLGLGIVERAAQLLNHDLRVQSELGRGSTFSILVSPGSATSVEALSSRPVTAAARARRPHVLIVDDDASVLKATRRLLKLDGFPVSTAASVAEATQLAGDHTDIELLITDFHLTNGEVGTDVIAAVRGITGTPVRAVVISGDTSLALRKVANQDPHVRIASKPVHAAELLSLIAELLES